jgi:hypothetical protein
VVVVAVVVAVSVEVCAASVLKSSDVEERLQVVGLTAFVGDLVTAQESVTVPVNEPDGVTVMAAVLPVVAPGASVIAPPLVREKEELPLPLPPLGACQKFPHPARNGAAASINLAHFPIFIAAPRFSPDGSCSKGNASECVLSCCGFSTQIGCASTLSEQTRECGRSLRAESGAMRRGFHIPWAILSS